MPADLVAFTTASRLRREVEWLLRDTQSAGFSNGLRIVGVGDQGLNALGWGSALTVKLAQQYELARSLTAPRKLTNGPRSTTSNVDPLVGPRPTVGSLDEKNRTVILFLDAYDLMIAGTEEQIVEKFFALRKKYPHCELFFNAEYWCPRNCAGADGYYATSKFPQPQTNPKPKSAAEYHLRADGGARDAPSETVDPTMSKTNPQVPTHLEVFWGNCPPPRGRTGFF